MTTDASWVDSMPELYDGKLGPALFRPHAVHLAATVAALAPRRVLELAAGTGIVTRELLRVLPDVELVATDLNPPMVAWAAERVPGASWAVADAQSLELPDASFDAVVCQFGVMFFPDKPRAFAEVARVLRPGGTLLFSVWDVVEASPMTAAMGASLAAVLPDPPTFIVRVPHGYTDLDRIRADLSAGGLEAVAIDRVAPVGTARSARDLAEGFALGSPLRFALQERGDVDALARALGDELTARLGEGPVDGELGAILVTARHR